MAMLAEFDGSLDQWLASHFASPPDLVLKSDDSVWVSANGGADTNAGTLASPLASLHAAADAVAAGGTARPTKVWLRAGVYRVRAEPLALNRTHSNTSWGCWPPDVSAGKNCAIDGSLALPPLANWAAATSPRVDKSTRPRVLQLDLTPYNLSTEELAPVGSSGTHLALAFGGLPMRLARWPNVAPPPSLIPNWTTVDQV
jgi:hypothetical protein